MVFLRRRFPWMTAFGIRIVGAVNLVLQFSGRHLRNGNASMRELIDELSTTGSGDFVSHDHES